MLTFVDIDNPDTYQVNHKDGNKLNNKLSNLEWCTQSENMKHAHATGLKVSHGAPKLNKSQVDQIRLLYKTGDYSQRKLASKFNVTQAQIWHIVNYKQWNKGKVTQAKRRR